MTMRNFGLFVLIVAGLTLNSCGNKQSGEEKPGLLSNLINITKNEDKGIKEILEFYGGYCKYAIGASASTDDGKKKYFEIEMSKSEIIEKYSKIAEMPASNIAYLFYRNLKEERSNYDEIHTVIVFNDESKTEFEFAKEDLALVDRKMSIVNKTVALLKAKDFEGIKAFLNPDTTIVDYDKDELIANLTKIDPQFGQIKEFVPYGFRFNQLKDGRQILHVSGVLSREKQNHEFSVDIDPNSNKDEIILMQYEL